MKIKTKKQMNLPQLIEHIVETSYECNKYIADNAKSSVYVGSIKGVVVEGTIFPTDTFTVEVEKELTKNTTIPHMLVIGRYDGYEEVFYQKLSDYNYNLLAAYLIDDDGMMTLIWRDGKLVE